MKYNFIIPFQIFGANWAQRWPDWAGDSTSAACSTQQGRSPASWSPTDIFWAHYDWPCGPTDKASDYESGDCRFESCQGQNIFENFLRKEYLMICIPGIQEISKLFLALFFLAGIIHYILLYMANE